MTEHRPLRYGMIGGGPEAFIGAVHRHAAALDGEIRLVAGAFSADPSRSREEGRALGLDPGRVYSSYEELIEREVAMPREQRIDFVSIVTPNHLHYRMARACLEAGLHVVCDKPLTHTVEEAEELRRLRRKHDRLFAVTYNYSGYPMVKDARALIHNDRLGTLRKVVVEYSQGWLSEALEVSGHKQAEWRTDPGRAGIGGALGDIGTHAEHLVRYVTGLAPEAVFADLSRFVEGRQLDDDANLLLRFPDEAKGVMIVSQVSVGEENGLSLRVYGTEASLEWRQTSPDALSVRYPDRPTEIRRRGQPYTSRASRQATRLPPGHPEGFIEAFANVYSAFAKSVRARRMGVAPDADEADYPTLEDGARGVHFVHAAVESDRTGAWVDARYDPSDAEDRDDREHTADPVAVVVDPDAREEGDG